MQNNHSFLPMVKNFIVENMPYGGYNMVSKRLADRNIHLNRQEVNQEVRMLKKDNIIPVLIECLQVMKYNKIELDEHCKRFLEAEVK